MLDVGIAAREQKESPGPGVCQEDGSRAGICPLSAECRDWRYQALWREGLHRRAMEREARLKEENAGLRRENRQLRSRLEDLSGELALRNKLLFAPSTEKETAAGRDGAPAPEEKRRRRRGQQPGSKGHGRRSNAHLPAVPEDHDLPDDEKCCPRCGRPLDPFPPDEESEQIEIEVRGYRRVHRRKRYRSTCGCPGTPGIVTGPPPPALIPKGRFGVSIWTSILVDKFHLLRPTYRLVKDFAGHGVFLSQGTITDGLRRLGPLFEPVYLALHEKSLLDDHWHADETRWLVFEKTPEGKSGRRRYLWIFRSPSAVFYILDRSRGSEVPRAFFGERATGIVSADRYSAYKSLMKDDRILVSFCWSHVRRDFLRVRDCYPKYAAWGQAWIDRISTLYELNKRRLVVGLSEGEFAIADEKLRRYLIEVEKIRDSELAEEPPRARRKVLKSLLNHWDGLLLFFGFPEVPLDNNEAERLLRSPVVGRKNYYGSGSEWSGRFAAMMFSIIQTLTVSGIEPRRWLTLYLEECARLRGRSPEDVSSFLPWNLSPEDRARLSVRAGGPDSS